MVARESLHHDHREAVESLIDVFAFLLRNLLVFVDALLFFTNQQARCVELGAVGRIHLAVAIDGVLDLAHGAGEDRDYALFVDGTTTFRTSVRLASAGLGHRSP